MTEHKAPGIDIDAILAEARLPERSVQLCLRGDLQARFEDLEDALEAAQQEPHTESLASSSRGSAVQVAREIEALRGEMLASTLSVTLRALPHREYRSLVAKHPARRDEDGHMIPDDVGLGLNEETFPSALILACWVEPAITESKIRTIIDEKLSNRQFLQLAEAAIEANRGDVDIPFSSAASKVIQTSSGE